MWPIHGVRSKRAKDYAKAIGLDIEASEALQQRILASSGQGGLQLATTTVEWGATCSSEGATP